MSTRGAPGDAIISTMTIYSLATFVHVLGAGGLFAATALEWVILRQMRRAATAEQAREALSLLRPAMLIGGPSAVLILLTGLHMAFAVWGMSKPWIACGLAAMVVAAGIGGAVNTRGLKLIGAQLGPDAGPLSAGVLGAISHSRLSAALRVRTGLLVAIVFLMTIQPDLTLSLLAPVAGAAAGYFGGLRRG